MLRLAQKNCRKKVNLAAFTPGDDRHKLLSEKKNIGRKVALNPVSLTQYKIEKRTSCKGWKRWLQYWKKISKFLNFLWPKTFPVRIFNADGSSYVIDHDKPQAVIQLPKITEDTDEVRKIFIRRTGTVQKDYTEFDDESSSKEATVTWKS